VDPDIYVTSSRKGHNSGALLSWSSLGGKKREKRKVLAKKTSRSPKFLPWSKDLCACYAGASGPAGEGGKAGLQDSRGRQSKPKRMPRVREERILLEPRQLLLFSCGWLEMGREGGKRPLEKLTCVTTRQNDLGRTLPVPQRRAFPTSLKGGQRT